MRSPSPGFLDALLSLNLGCLAALEKGPPPSYLPIVGKDVFVGIVR